MPFNLRALLKFLHDASEFRRDERVPAVLPLFDDLRDPINTLLTWETLTPAQLLKIAAGNMVLCRFRFDNRVLGDMLTGYVKDKIMASSHAAVLMAGQAAEPLAA